MGAIANITEDGFPPAAFHSYPSTLRIDGITGDYGPGFFAHAINTGTYVTRHPEFGWLAFGGNLTVEGEVVTGGAPRLRPLPRLPRTAGPLADPGRGYLRERGDLP